METKNLILTKENLLEAGGTEDAINRDLINAMVSCANLHQNFNSCTVCTYGNPTFSICKVEDIENISKYIVRGLTNYRYTNHDTIEFSNINARSYLRINVDMNTEDLSDKCAVFDSNKDVLQEEDIVRFAPFITKRTLYCFNKKYIPYLFMKYGRIFGELKYTSLTRTYDEVGMLGFNNNTRGLEFLPVNTNAGMYYKFSIKDIVKFSDFTFIARDYRLSI